MVSATTTAWFVPTSAQVFPCSRRMTSEFFKRFDHASSSKAFCLPSKGSMAECAPPFRSNKHLRNDLIRCALEFDDAEEQFQLIMAWDSPIRLFGFKVFKLFLGTRCERWLPCFNHNRYCIFWIRWTKSISRVHANAIFAIFWPISSHSFLKSKSDGPVWKAVNDLDNHFRPRRTERRCGCLRRLLPACLFRLGLMRLRMTVITLRPRHRRRNDVPPVIWGRMALGH